MNLAYNLKDSAGDYCFGDISPELIKEHRDFDDVYNATLVTVRPLSTLTLSQSLVKNQSIKKELQMGFVILQQVT